jgi:hypothetical protein
MAWQALYPRALFEMARATRPGGGSRAVILTMGKQVMRRGARGRSTDSQLTLN